MNKKMGKVTRNYKKKQTRNENIIGIKLENKTTDNGQNEKQTKQTSEQQETRRKSRKKTRIEQTKQKLSGEKV